MEDIMYCHRYQVDGKEIKHTFEEKDLSIIVDSKLDFTEHIAQKVKKTNRIFGIIRRSYAALQKESIVKLFTALVRPYVEYGRVIWSPHLRKFQRLFEDVQIRATKLVDGFGKFQQHERLKN